MLQYIPLLLFLILVAAAMIVEARWLSAKGWARDGKAWMFVIATDLIGFGIGLFVSFAIFGIMLMMVFGPSGMGSGLSEVSYVVLLIIALLAPAVVLFFVKRIFLLFFSMRDGKEAWLFSLAASFAATVFVALPPPVVLYLVGRFS